MKVTAVCLVQQVRLQAVTADNGHDFFLMDMTVSLLGFLVLCFTLHLVKV